MKRAWALVVTTVAFIVAALAVLLMGRRRVVDGVELAETDLERAHREAETNNARAIEEARDKVAAADAAAQKEVERAESPADSVNRLVVR